MPLEALGWDEGWAVAFESWAGHPDVQPARVAVEFNHIYRVHAADGERDATASGRLKHNASSRSELPAVGDWVVVRRRPEHERAAIIGILPRRSRFSRKAAGQVTGEQVVAANVDTVFVVMGLDVDFNLRRLERYLLLARESGASPVVLLTKPDLAGDLQGQIAAAKGLAGSAPVHVVSPRLDRKSVV